MASSEVVAAFETKLAAEWTQCPIVDENAEGDTPKNGSPFMVVTYPLVLREQITFGAPGANSWRETGAARLVINVRRGGGVDEGRGWAQQLVRMFLGKDLGGVITGAPDGPVTDDRNENGQYYRLAVAVPYEFDFNG